MKRSIRPPATHEVILQWVGQQRATIDVVGEVEAERVVQQILRTAKGQQLGVVVHIKEKGAA